MWVKICRCSRSHLPRTRLGPAAARRTAPTAATPSPPSACPSGGRRCATGAATKQLVLLRAQPRCMGAAKFLQSFGAMYAR